VRRIAFINTQRFLCWNRDFNEKVISSSFFWHTISTSNCVHINSLIKSNSATVFLDKFNIHLKMTQNFQNDIEHYFKLFEKSTFLNSPPWTASNGAFSFFHAMIIARYFFSRTININSISFQMKEDGGK
jgi:hypothetical protein